MWYVTPLSRRLIALTLFAFSAFGLTPPSHQRVLVPLHEPTIAGANGSRWTTELWVVNASGDAAPIAAVPCIVTSNLIHCVPLVTVPPNRTLAIPALGTAEKPGGAAAHLDTDRPSRVRISIEPITDPLALVAPNPFWAFVTVTNNTTQQVTTVVPR